MHYKICFIYLEYLKYPKRFQTTCNLDAYNNSRMQYNYHHPDFVKLRLKLIKIK